MFANIKGEAIISCNVTGNQKRIRMEQRQSVTIRNLVFQDCNTNEVTLPDFNSIQFNSIQFISHLSNSISIKGPGTSGC